MSEVSQKLIEQFKNFVARANPSILHPLDERRLNECLVALHLAGHKVDEHLIAEIWPEETASGLGGDPAHSTYLRDRVYIAANTAGEVLSIYEAAR
ncbi:hypothetical protein KBY28_03630 [Ruegeria pomeroyi]|uniref:hypothetical protein n=1 Tax=Ruegeria pomeroyi TaxID=89184 RepID=UPI001F46CA46|nr:hypothetical protein [Ruegeria pomeroyi]MCE8507536.1 hypothetical protein [Ruegeria pomeroyi]